MYDYHIHSVRSLDVDKIKGGNVSKLCREAIKKGFTEIAITDHCDIDNEYYLQCEKLDVSGLYRDVLEARELYGDKISVLFGLELGQAHHLPKLSERLINRFPFDFVIGSVHSVREIIDFSFHDFTILTDKEILDLWERYLIELEEIIDWGLFDMLAHITYPYRYICYAERGDVLDFKKDGRDMFEKVLKKLIEKGLCLEINTSGLRQNLEETLPSRSLLEHYKHLGGELITIGSDAHFPEHLGAGIKEARKMAKELGFEYIARFKNRERYMEKLN